MNKLSYKFMESEPTFDSDTRVVEAVISSSRRDLEGDSFSAKALSAWKDSMVGGKKICMLRNHDINLVAGQWNEFETKVASDGHVELFAQGEVFVDLPEGKTASTLLDQKLVEGLSVGYRAGDVKFVDGGRDIGKVLIKEASIVNTFPTANPDAQIRKKMYGEDGRLDVKTLQDLLSSSVKEEDVALILEAFKTREARRSQPTLVGSLLEVTRNV